MAVVVVAEVEGGDQAFYERISGQAMEGDNLPEGCQVHIAGPAPSGWRVITVWDSEQDFERFRNENLIPALQAAGEGNRMAPSIEAQPVHRLITA